VGVDSGAVQPATPNSMTTATRGNHLMKARREKKRFIIYLLCRYILA
jgi:hypothetical protein